MIVGSIRLIKFGKDNFACIDMDLDIKLPVPILQ